MNIELEYLISTNGIRIFTNFKSPTSFYFVLGF